MALRAAQGTGPCAPHEVAPNVWVTPLCKALPVVRTAPSARALAFRSRQAPPLEVDHRRDGLEGPVKNQEQVGICWAFALSTTMENAIRRSGRQDVIAPLHVVAARLWDELWKDPSSKRAVTLEPTWPYDPKKACELSEDSQEVWCEQSYGVRPGSWRSDPALVAEVERADLAGYYSIAHVEHLPTEPADPEEIAALLAAGEAIWASFGLEWNAWSWTGIGKDGVIPDYEVEETRHAVVLAGYRTVGFSRQFLLHNSWGETWGAGGFAWISETMVRRFLRSALTVQVEVTGTPPSAQTGQAPGPTVPPSTATCPPGQARDAVLATCVPACPDGSMPAVGFCLPGAPTTRPTSECPAGQARDMLTGACLPLCPPGQGRVGGLCLPLPTGAGY
jgi:hypothetical protein